MKKILKYLLHFLTLVPVVSHARDFAGYLDNIDSMNQYLKNLKPEIFNDNSKILLRSGTLSVTARVNRLSLEQHYKYKVEKLILINNTSDIDDLISVSLPYSPGIKLSDIEGRVYNYENGSLVVDEIKKSDLIKEKFKGRTRIAKFNFPNVKKGSIVYCTFTYSYSIYGMGSSGLYYHNIPWNFQDDYYVLDSWFDATIDKGLNYDQYNRNVLFTNCTTFEQLTESKSGIWLEEGKRKKRIVYHRQGLDAYKSEPGVLGDDQYIENITFRFSPSRAELPRNWDSANTRHLYGSEGLGKLVYQPDDTLTLLVNKIKLDYKNVDFVKAAYCYVRDSITCFGFSEQRRIWASRYPKYVWQSRQGTIPDKNLLLCALYRKAGLNSHPVVLSTDQDVKLSENFVDIDLLNYTVCDVEYEGRSIILDASYHYIPFGMLPPRCYNDFALQIDEKAKPIALTRNQLTDKTFIMATVKPTEKNGIFSLKLEHRLGNVSALKIRAVWASDSIKAKKMIDAQATDMKYKVRTIDWSIANVQNPDSQLTITYNLELDLGEPSERIYLNPFFIPLMETNPFKDIDRKYPVDYQYNTDNRFLLKFTLPEGYTLEDADENSNFDFKNGGIKYSSTMLYDPGQGVFSLNSTLLFKTTTVAVSDYQALRSFYESVVQDQHKSIVLKRSIKNK